tara:strand:- start:53 stop:502 length:450 start_codon:yes stop_codon:yes gene_type:complete
MKGMHLLPAYYTTTNTKRRKKQKKTKSLIAAEKEHQKFLERMGVNQTKARVAQSVEQGFCKPQAVGSNPTSGTISRSLAQPGSASALGAEGQRFESSNSDQFYNPTMAKKEEKVYTGTEIMGIAQMHKSNAVPVRNKKSAEEVAKMRRG